MVRVRGSGVAGEAERRVDIDRPTFHVPVSAVRSYLRAATARPEQYPELDASLREVLEGLLADAVGGGVPLASLPATPQGTIARAHLARFAGDSEPATVAAWPSRPGIDLSGGKSATARQAEALVPPPARAGVGIPGSILHGGGAGDAVSPALRRLLPDVSAGTDDRAARVDPRTHVADPDAVMRRPTSVGIDQRICVILLTHEGAPRTGELLAQTLAELFGPYDLVPGESRVAAQARLDSIDAHLAWIEDAIAYEHDRLKNLGFDTYAPNETLSRNGGVCRDIHLATTAIHASLMNVRLVGGVWRAGSPAGREDRAQTLGFETPTEAHAFRTWRHPLSGEWRASEYGKQYAIDAPTSADAFENVVGAISGFTRYTIRGWDEEPAVNDRGVSSAARANAFFERNPGTGEAGEVRAAASATSAGATYFFTPRLSLSGEIDPSALGAGVRGGIKLDYHEALRPLDPKGYVHAAGGVYSDFYDASRDTGLRGAADRARYHVYVFAVQCDGRYEGDPMALVGEHLRLTWGADWNLRLGVPIGRGGGNGAHVMPLGLGDYSAADAGADVGFTGTEKLGERLQLDWALRGRGRFDVINLGTEVITSGGGAPAQSALADPWRTAFALSLRHEGEAVTTRFEVGGTRFLSRPYDEQTTPRETHYAAVSVGSRHVSFGVIGKGETLDGDFVPVDALGIALGLEPTRNVAVGLGAESVFPGGDVRRIGERLQVTGALTLRL